MAVPETMRQMRYDGGRSRGRSRSKAEVEAEAEEAEAQAAAMPIDDDESGSSLIWDLVCLKNLVHNFTVAGLQAYSNKFNG